MVEMSLAQQAEFQRFAKKSRRERFLEEMDAVMPWSELLALIEPHYPKGEKGRPPVGLSILLRLYFVQHWFALSAPAAEDDLYDLAAPQAQDMTSRRVKTKAGVDEAQKLKNRTKARVRAKVEWPFRILKRVFGFTKVRYRGLKKNQEWLCVGFAQVNLYRNRKRLARINQRLVPQGA